jgi:hypothetical protein
MCHQNDFGHGGLLSGFILQALVQAIIINLEDGGLVIAASFIGNDNVSIPMGSISLHVKRGDPLYLK